MRPKPGRSLPAKVLGQRKCVATIFYKTWGQKLKAGHKRIIKSGIQFLKYEHDLKPINAFSGTCRQSFMIIVGVPDGHLPTGSPFFMAKKEL